MMGKEGDSPQPGRGTHPTRSSQEKKQVWPPGTVLMNRAQEKGSWRCSLQTQGKIKRLRFIHGGLGFQAHHLRSGKSMPSRPLERSLKCKPFEMRKN